MGDFPRLRLRADSAAHWKHSCAGPPRSLARPKSTIEDPNRPSSSEWDRSGPQAVLRPVEARPRKLWRLVAVSRPLYSHAGSTSTWMAKRLEPVRTADIRSKSSSWRRKPQQLCLAKECSTGPRSAGAEASAPQPTPKEMRKLGLV
mmetsp:Transcript_7646/g.21788  ORF Transcript_7646/g.21788 Transcript_7646/m.21788 type:complete len:146 (-) Transcript_7646:799-1236(-)